MIWAVLDTNVIVSGIGWAGPSADVLDAAVGGRFVMVTSSLLLAELNRVIAYPKLAGAIKDRSQVLRQVREVALLVEPSVRLSVIADEPDNRVLEAAIEGRADVIVSGNRHLLDVGSYARIRILTPKDFFELLEE